MCTYVLCVCGVGSVLWGVGGTPTGTDCLRVKTWF